MDVKENTGRGAECKSDQLVNIAAYIARHAERLASPLRPSVEPLAEIKPFSHDDFLRSLSKDEYRDFLAYSRHVGRAWARLPPLPPERSRFVCDLPPRKRSIDPEQVAKAEADRAAIRKAYPAEFNDGAACGFTNETIGAHEPGGYLKGFHGWPLERRNAWFAGWNKGDAERRRIEEAQDD
jgi:hypothetical protein